jgi:hypothetical protein
MDMALATMTNDQFLLRLTLPATFPILKFHAHFADELRRQKRTMDANMSCTRTA